MENNNNISLKYGSDEEFFVLIFDRHIPLEPKTVQLEIKTKTTKELFEFLLHLFTESMKLKFSHDGNKVLLHECSLEQINELNKYFMSFGIIFILNFYPIYNQHNIEKDLLIPYPTVSSFDLKDYKFQLLVDDKIYIIYFDLI